MTEKRFIQKNIKNEALYDMIYDAFEKKECCRLCSALTEQEQEVAKVVDLLNKQEAKIKELKKDNELWKQLLSDSSLSQRINAVERENEALEKENREYKHFFEALKQGYWDEDYLTPQDWRDIKSRIETILCRIENG